jgi:5-hydroxyisourate hydrolase
MTELVVFVMDLEKGKPAAGIPCSISLSAENNRVWVGKAETATDGCARITFTWPAASEELSCRVALDTGRHFQGRERDCTFPEICIDFFCSCSRQVVLPVLISAHGYTTYRGQ